MRDIWQLHLRKLSRDRNFKLIIWFFIIYILACYILIKELSKYYGKKHCLEYNSSKVLRYCVYLTIAMVTGLFD